MFITLSSIRESSSTECQGAGDHCTREFVRVHRPRGEKRQKMARLLFSTYSTIESRSRLGRDPDPRFSKPRRTLLPCFIFAMRFFDERRGRNGVRLGVREPPNYFRITDYFIIRIVQDRLAYPREITTDFSSRWQIDANPAWETSTFTHETRSELIAREYNGSARFNESRSKVCRATWRRRKAS